MKYSLALSLFILMVQFHTKNNKNWNLSMENKTWRVFILVSDNFDLLVHNYPPKCLAADLNVIVF